MPDTCDHGSGWHRTGGVDGRVAGFDAVVTHRRLQPILADDLRHVEEQAWVGRDTRAWDGSVPAALRTAVMQLVLARVQWSFHFADMPETQLRKAYAILTASLSRSVVLTPRGE
eukprot:2341489-Amphidinium_carterae.1